MPNSLENDFRLFTEAAYSTAKEQNLAYASLLRCMEDVHSAVNGLSAVALLIASNQVNRGGELELSDVTLEQLHGLTRVTLSLLAEKIEVTADAVHQAAFSQLSPIE